MDAKTRKTLESLYSLYKRPGTQGEKAAAKAAIDRINQRLPKHEQLQLDKPKKDLSIDDLLKDLGIDDEPTLSDGSSIFKSKEDMRKRWAKMAQDAKNSKRKGK